jgi:hypothetical protein
MKRIVFGLILIVTVPYLVGSVTAADLDGRYSNSPLKPWLDHLASGKGSAARWRMAKRSQTPIGTQRTAIIESGSKLAGSMFSTMR